MGAKVILGQAKEKVRAVHIIINISNLRLMALTSDWYLLQTSGVALFLSMFIANGT
jgi:hypothetical protein